MTKKLLYFWEHQDEYHLLFKYKLAGDKLI